MSNTLRQSIRQILLASSASVIAAGIIGTASAALGVQNPPPGPGQVPDYFGVVPNYANSPQPIMARVVISDSEQPGAGAEAGISADPNAANAIDATSLVVTAGGSGYVNPVVSIIDNGGEGLGATAKVSKMTSGVIEEITLTNPGSGYLSPIITITEGTRGSGAIAAATTYDYGKDVGSTRIMDVQVLNGGSGYSPSTKVEVTNDNGAVVSLHPIIENGVITGFQEIPNPLPADWVGLESTDVGTSFKQPLVGTGIRKFVDSLPGLNSANNLGQQLPVAVADKISFPGADYYEIAEVEYSKQLHSDLPNTHLRGYVQIKQGGFNLAAFDALTTADEKRAYASQYAHYLGPIIVAQKDRPVRVKLINKLSKSSDSSGLKGGLPFPVDHTYMGSDKGESDNRTAMHLHGGNTPWISDGLPRQWVKPAGEAGHNRGETARNVPDMWFDANGNLFKDGNGAAITHPDAATIAAQGLSNDPGAGTLTFFYTNQQSQRMMFYHDHAEGITRLNVYDGMAAGYVLQDPTEVQLINNEILPDDQIPLVIQDKTFVPDDSHPVLNFYGPFKSQLNSQDPTWRWGSGVAAPALNGTGDLWVPHVFMTNQNPGDPSGANPLGRWDYGPWFWPPFVGIQHEQVANPYYDAACDTTTGTNVNPLLGVCEGQFMPGTPNGALIDANGQPLTQYDSNGAIDPKMSEPSGQPEAFHDLMAVNGTVYPFMNVSPKKYRLRILSVGNDRHLNLSLVVASSKNGPNTAAEANAGAASTTALQNTCNGVNLKTADAGNCTEVRMQPWTSAQNKVTPFPSWWYSFQKTGVVFDGRPSGVFDPALRGPAMVQVGTEGGFLSSPVVVKNQPINFEYNVKNIVVTNVKEHALLLGPAERADVVVDFSQFAGSTLIMYNDAPAALPAGDLRLDYYTNGFDNTDTGGAMMTQPGYGPNTRTIMQFRVAASCPATDVTCGKGINRTPSTAHPVDDVDTTHLAKLTSAVRHAFATSQEPIIVPQAAYNATYNTNVSDVAGGDLSRISDNFLHYKPLLAVDPTSGQGSIDSVETLLDFQPKSIIEDWTKDYGRMNAMLGVEMPHTTAINQTSMPQGYLDPATELVKLSEHGQPISGTAADGTQLWKITHNGVDTHPIHFHLFHVQLVNRVGWDGAIYPPQENELGWKDIVRMNPLEDVVVALRPRTMSLPFKVGNSHHTPDPSEAVGALPNTAMAFNLDPTSGNASNVTNLSTNYGWEYVWHCHILGHEENDMMRAIAVAAEPEAPSNLTATTQADGVKLDWNDNSIIANWFTITRATDNGFTQNVQTFNVSYPECTDQNGCARSYLDTTAVAGTDYVYKVVANNTVGAGEARVETGRNPTTGVWNEFLPAIKDGTSGANSALTPKFTGYASVTASSQASASVGGTGAAPQLTLSSAALDFAAQLQGTSSAPQVITLSNSGTAPLTISSISLSGAYVETHNCNTAKALAPNASCVISVSFKPSAAGTQAGTLTVVSNDPAGNDTTSLNGQGVSAVLPVISANLMPSAPIRVSLNWSPSSTVATQADSYQVQRGQPLQINGDCPTASSAYSNIGAATSQTSAIDATVTAGQNACYRVIASNPAGQYIATAVKVSVPTAPAGITGLSISGATPTALNLVWTASIGATGYDIQKCVGLALSGNCGATGTGWVNVGTTTGTGYNVANLSTGTPYLFRVRAYNPVASAWSTTLPKFAYPKAVDNTATATANTSSPQGLSALNVLSNDLPSGVATCSATVTINCRKVLSVSAVTHTGGNGMVGSIQAIPGTAAVACTTSSCTLTLTAVLPAGTLTGTQQQALRQASKRGVYSYTYTLQYINSYGSYTTTATATTTVN